MATKAEVEAVIRARDEATRTLKKVSTNFGGLAKSAATAGLALTALSTGAMALFLRSATKAASRAQETQNLFEVSFGEMTKDAEDWARATQAAVGVNDTTLKEMSGQLFQITANMGLTREAAFSMATGFTQAAIDASSFFNVDFQTSLEKIRAGLIGSSEPLLQFGIDVRENAILQTEFAQKILATGRELSNAEKVQARAIVIAKGLKGAQDDLLKTQDSWANQTRLLGEVWTDLQETVGEFVVNSPEIGKILAAITMAVGQMKDFVVANKDAIKAWIREGFLNLLSVIPVAINAFALLKEAVGGVGAGLGVSIQGFAGLGLAIDDFSRKMPGAIVGATLFSDEQRKSAESALEFGASLEESGAAAFRSGQDIRDFANNTKSAIDGIIESLDAEEKATGDVSETTKTWTKLLDSLTGEMAAAGGQAGTTSAEFRKMLEAQVSLTSSQQFYFQNTLPGVQGKLKLVNREFRDLKEILPGVAAEGVNSFGNIIEETVDAEAAQKAYNQALQEAANLAQIIPGFLGDIISGTFAAAGALKNLSAGGKGLFGGLADAFKAGTGGQGGILGLIGGIGGLAPVVGPLINLGTQIAGPIIKGIGKIFKSGPNLVRDAARDMGATITQEMADAIEASGEHIQLAVADIFEAGGFESADRFAEEIGDIFSGIEQGLFSAAEATPALEEAVALLLPIMGELGEKGQAEVERIIAAADRLGIEFEGLSDLIQTGFAPQTMEEMAASLGLTNDQVRALAETLDVELQTNLERAAAAAGLTVDEFRALQAAAGEALGQEGAASMEQLQALMDATGLSADQLAEKLGVAVTGGAGTLAEEAAEGQAQLSGAADQASRLAEELERAARAAAGINVPSGGSGGIPGMATGGIVPASPPFGSLRRLGEREAEAVIPLSKLGGGGGGVQNVTNVMMNFNLEGAIVTPEAKAQIVAEGLRRATRDGLISNSDIPS